MVSNGFLWTEIRLPIRIIRIPKGSCICLKIMVSANKVLLAWLFGRDNVHARMRVLVAYEYGYRFYREKVVAKLKQYDFEGIWINLPEEQLQKLREPFAD